MSTQRNTHLTIAHDLRRDIECGKYTDVLPSLREIAAQYGVSRGVAIRAVDILKEEDVVDAVHGSGLYVAGTRDVRPMVDRVTELLLGGGFAVGDTFPSEMELCEQLGTTRPSLRATLGRLEGQGLIGRRKGRRRIVLALPEPPDKEAE